MFEARGCRSGLTESLKGISCFLSGPVSKSNIAIYPSWIEEADERMGISFISVCPVQRLVQSLVRVNVDILLTDQLAQKSKTRCTIRKKIQGKPS